MKRLLILPFLFFITMSGGAGAQSGETDDTCAVALSDAQSTYDDGDLDTALALANEAQIACTSDIFGFRDAINLTVMIEYDLDQQAVENEIQAATPGLVDIGDYSIFMTCEGQGSPTIIFENGLGWNVDTWNDVYPTVGETTRVCRYDRLGVGYSDSVPDLTPRSSLEQARDLHAILEFGQIDGP